MRINNHRRLLQFKQFKRKKDGRALLVSIYWLLIITDQTMDRSEVEFTVRLEP